ncbi:methyltransferase domain-containing protein [Kibdelosporangium lantanae]
MWIMRIAGDFDYETHGQHYSTVRRADPRIARYVHAALGDARTVLNVGAGAGSYEPEDREVTAVEPSASMRSQRPPHLAKAIDATAEQLPFADNSFDASMASVTVHHWPDTARGLREMRRVTRGPVVVLTFDPDLIDTLWLNDYVPEFFDAERKRYPAITFIRDVLGGTSTVTPIPIPPDCVDGFTEAFYARPEMFLDPAVRASQSAWGFVAPEAIERGIAKLAADLESGAWATKYGDVAAQPEFVGAVRLITAVPTPDART